MATQITATLPTLNFPREVDYPTQEDWAAFSAAAELNFGILGNDWSTQMQLWKTEANAMSTELNTNATIATGLANFQGAWSNAVTYSKGQSVESTTGSKIYYTSKVDNNLNHSVADTNYWVYNPINDKLNTDFSLLTDKATPSDTDIFAIRESGGLLKKLSWANLKATLKTYFDTLYMGLTENQTVAGNKNFTGNLLMTGSSSIIGYGTGAGGTVTQATSKTTAVTLNKPTGQITMNNSTLGAGATVLFQLNNSLINTMDTFMINSFNNLSYRVESVYTTDGAAGVRVTNVVAGSLSEALVLNFTISKGANS